jgi:hypothetical protein
MSNGYQEVWAQIVKYSSVANGTALTLALSTIGKSPVVQLNASIGKFPIWCFFLGLLASGLHLVFTFASQYEKERFDVHNEIEKLTERVNATRAEALALGKISSDAAANTATIDQLRLRMTEIGKAPITTELKLLNGITEGLLWVSYAFFFVGLFAVVQAV